MAKEEPIQLEGVISQVMPSTLFKVKLANGHEVLAHISGKMRKRWIRIAVGDNVTVEMSPYDLTKARIVWRKRLSAVADFRLRHHHFEWRNPHHHRRTVFIDSQITALRHGAAGADDMKAVVAEMFAG